MAALEAARKSEGNGAQPANADEIAHFKAVIAEGERAYPHEGCGLLVGRREGDDFVVTEAPTAHNENTDRPRVWYDLSPADQLRIAKDAQKRGLDVIGYYHSHPDHPALPSEGDRSRAEHHQEAEETSHRTRPPVAAPHLFAI